MANEFKPNVGSTVSKKEAMEWMDKYDQEMRKDKSKDTRSIFYGREMLEKILNDKSVAGITFCFALKYNDAVKKETLQLVLVPTREDGTFVWGDESEAAKGGGGGVVAYDGGVHCPPYCG